MRPVAMPAMMLGALCAAAPSSFGAETERNVVPFVGGDSDVGFGFGALGSIARVEPGYEPYRWNVEATGLFTFKVADGLHAPYQDAELKLTIPEFFPHVRLVVNPGFNREVARYYGIGNASTTDVPATVAGDDAERRYFLWARTHPWISAELRYEAFRQVSLIGGVTYTQSWIDIHAPSKLADDAERGAPEVQRLLADPSRTNGVALFTTGLQWDARDDEINPTRGAFNLARLRVSPGGLATMPYRYANIELTSRVFIQLGTPKLVLAGRWTIDLLTGEPPFYELARFEETNAIGGPYGVRGVPAQRYYGKIKSFGGVELRVDAGRIRAFEKKLAVGFAGFFDAGRVWADYGAHPELDGSGIGLKYGVGLGLRVRSGQTFVLRADVAWSPDATPIAGYLGAGHAF
jgi:outer membrane protein assembly factor BamA